MTEMNVEQNRKEQELQREDLKGADQTAGFKYCPSCGEQVPEDSNFCPFCGNSVSAVTEPKQTETKQETKAPAASAADTAAKPLPGIEPVKPLREASQPPRQEALKTTKELQKPETEPAKAAEPTVVINIPNIDPEKVKENINKMDIPGKAQSARSFVDRMYDNVGGALCMLAKIAFYFGAITSILSGFGIMLAGCRIGGPIPILTFIIGILVIVIGVFLAWLGTLALYAFGEITRRLKSIDEKLK
ncbi:MAG: zinc ribbon domain-containing protein [Solobacterium sp.]|nr:zinc ribbon domain-containing protein [Solobacterium sp.]